MIWANIIRAGGVACDHTDFEASNLSTEGARHNRRLMTSALPDLFLHDQCRRPARAHTALSLS